MPITQRVHTGKFEQNSRTFQGLLKAILQFTRTKSLSKFKDFSRTSKGYPTVFKD